MSALWHSVVIASSTGAIVTSGNDTSVAEPLPGGTDLTTIAAHGLASEETAAASGIGDRKEGLERSTSGDAHTIVESLGGSMSPA